MSGLHIDSVVKHYGNKQILTDIFVSCQVGEIIGLLGGNGSGKSTLLKIVFGAMSADNKFVKAGEKHIIGVEDCIKRIKYLPQDSFLPNHISIRKVISMFCNRRQIQIIENNELFKPLLNKKTYQLSGGERRLLELYLIIYAEAEYILLDEPFNGLDPLHKEEVMGLIKEQSKEKGFIITDHDYRNVMNVATKIILLHDGNVKNIKNKEELVRWGYVPENTFR